MKLPNIANQLNKLWNCFFNFLLAYVARFKMLWWTCPSRLEKLLYGRLRISFTGFLSKTGRQPLTISVQQNGAKFRLKIDVWLTQTRCKLAVVAREFLRRSVTARDQRVARSHRLVAKVEWKYVTKWSISLCQPWLRNGFRILVFYDFSDWQC